MNLCINKIQTVVNRPSLLLDLDNTEGFGPVQMYMVVKFVLPNSRRTVSVLFLEKIVTITTYLLLLVSE